MKKTIAQIFKAKIKNAASIDEKIYIENLARKEAKLDFGDKTSNLKFSDDSILKLKR